jgi:hypothetical protein
LAENRWNSYLSNVDFVASLFAIHRGVQALAEKYEISAVLMPVAVIVLGGIVIFRIGGWDNNELSDERLSQKIYLMAQILDFNSKHNCDGIPSNPVIFIGPTQERVLVAPALGANLDFTSFFSAHIEVPERFVQADCRPMAVPSTWRH